MRKKETIESILKDYEIEGKYRSYGDKAGRFDFSINGRDCSIFFDEETVSISTEKSHDWLDMVITNELENDIKRVLRWIDISGEPFFTSSYNKTTREVEVLQCLK